MRPCIFRFSTGLTSFLGHVRVPTVAVVGLDAFIWLEEVRQTGGEDLDVGPCPGGVRALDPHQVAHQNVNAQLVAKGGLPRILVGPERVALLCSPLLGDTEVRPIHRH